MANSRESDVNHAPPNAMIRCCLAALCWSQASRAAAEQRGWEFEPYRIQAVLAIDVPGGLAEQLADELPPYVRRRVAAAIGPVWSFELQLATGALRQRVLAEIGNRAETSPADFPSGGDKLLLLAVRWRPEGYELTAREFDRYVERWGMPISRPSQQVEALGEQLFELVWQAVAPLARWELAPQDNHRVVLHPRGAALPRSGGDANSVKPGDMFLPVLRRTTRGGKLIAGGIQTVPWTYIEALEAEGDKIGGRVHSGSRQPFGARRQGRVEQVAIALRADPGETIVRLQSRTNPDKPLIGYEVFSQNAGAEATTRIGSSDHAGRIGIPPGTTRVQLLFVKNGSQLLARLPLVPGAEPQVVDVPLPDDDMRLAAETRLAALREDLVDVVARRNILMARTRQKIEQSDFAAAQQLLRALDELPGRSQFDLQLTNAARLLRSDDPQIQRRIDQLVAATQTVLSQYLDVRPISQLHDELREGQRKK